MYNVHTACKPRIRLALLSSGAYGLLEPPRRFGGKTWFHVFISDRDFARRGRDLEEVLEYYRKGGFESLHEGLKHSVFFIPAA